MCELVLCVCVCRMYVCVYCLCECESCRDHCVTHHTGVQEAEDIVLSLTDGSSLVLTCVHLCSLVRHELVFAYRVTCFISCFATHHSNYRFCGYFAEKICTYPQVIMNSMLLLLLIVL